MSDPKPNIISHITVYYLRNDTGAASSSPSVAPLTDAQLKAVIESAAAASSVVEVNVVGQSKSFVDSVWEPTKGDFYTAVHDKVNTYARFNALVVAEDLSSSSSSSASGSINSIIDGDVMYALMEKNIPVLRLVMDGGADEGKISAAGSSSSSSYAVRKHRMLTTTDVLTTADAVAAAATAFFTFPAHQGRVIVVEGGDGAGKQTQVKKLFDRLIEEGYAAETLDYPHDAAGYGVMIRELLSGKMGNIKEVNPLIFATLYGVNRHSTLPLLKLWVQRGANIILDRYMTANFGHQASKYEKDEERIAAINTLRTFELKWLALPDADKVFYLNLPPDFALKAMQSDDTRRELDMHELAGIEYKNNVRRSFLWCCETFSATWKEIRCVDEAEAQRYSREDVHAAIYDNVAPLLVNKKKVQ